MANFEPFGEVRVAVSPAGMTAAAPPAREEAEVTANVAPVAARGPPVVTADPAALDLPSSAAAALILRLCRRRVSSDPNVPPGSFVF